MQSESVYAFTVPRPDIVMVRRALLTASIVGAITALFAMILGAPFIPLLIALSCYAIVAVHGLFMGWRMSRRSGEVTVTSTHFAINQGGGKREWAWSDIRSVRFGKLHANNPFTQVLVYRGDQFTYAEVRLRRPRFGIALPVSGSIRLYIQDAEAFKREAQQYLSVGLS